MVTQTNSFKFKGKLNIPIMERPSQPKILNSDIYCSLWRNQHTLTKAVVLRNTQNKT